MQRSNYAALTLLKLHNPIKPHFRNQNTCTDLLIHIQLIYVSEANISNLFTRQTMSSALPAYPSSALKSLGSMQRIGTYRTLPTHPSTCGLRAHEH